MSASVHHRYHRGHPPAFGVVDGLGAAGGNKEGGGEANEEKIDGTVNFEELD